MRTLVQIVALLFMSLLFNHVIHLGSLVVCVGPGFSSVQRVRGLNLQNLQPCVCI